MNGLLTRRRLARLAGFASTQMAVQALAFVAGIVLVRSMAQVDYGYYTLAITLVGIANVVTELGVANAVLAIGGRIGNGGALHGGLLADARALHLRLAALALAAILPPFAWLLWHQHAAPAEIALLTVLAGATAWLNVRTQIALSVARLQGGLAQQQRLDLGLNAARLVAVVMAAAVWLDAVVASALNLATAAALYACWRRWLAARGLGARPAGGDWREELHRSVARQAPNSLYYVLSSQLAAGLVAVFGTADRIADVGALGRLGAAFAVVAAVLAGVAQPFLARHHRPAELEKGFLAVNLFFAATTLGLAAAARLCPDAILWVLGRHYAGLRAELLWMTLASSLSAWGGALYTLGCGRDWVLPSPLGIGCGLAATIVGIRCFDVATVAGNFQLVTTTAGVATLVNVAHIAWRLHRHRRAGAEAGADASADPSADPSADATVPLRVDAPMEAGR